MVFILSSFYNFFIEECARKDVSPSFVASAAGLSRAAYSGWKRGTLPSDTNLTKLAYFFGIPVEAFHECDDIKARDIKLGIQRKINKIAAYQKDEEKKTATNGDGLNESDDNMAIRQKLQERPEMKTLFDVASDAPASAIYEAISIILKAKEGS